MPTLMAYSFVYISLETPDGHRKAVLVRTLSGGETAAGLSGRRSEVRIRRRGRAIVLEPVPDSWAWLDALAEELDEDFVFAVREQPGTDGAARAQQGVPLMRDLLDANAVITLLNDTTSAIARRTRRHAPQDIGLPAIVLHELDYGALKVSASTRTCSCGCAAVLRARVRPG